MNRRNMVLGLGVTPLAYGMPPTEPPQEPELKLESYVHWQTFPYDAKAPNEMCAGTCTIKKFLEHYQPLMEKAFGKIYYKPIFMDHKFVYDKNRRTIVWEYV